jgi:hypothetical protein
MKRVSIVKTCVLLALPLGLSAGLTLAVPPVIAQQTAADALSGGGPNPKAVMMYNLGITAYKQGSTDAAVIFFKRACDIDPNLADAQYNLAVIFQAQKRYKEAVPRFEEVLRLKPNDADAHYQLGVILHDNGSPQQARVHLAAIAPNSAHFPDAQRRLAQLNAAPAQQPTAYAPPTQPPQQQPQTNPFLQPQQPAYVAPQSNPFLAQPGQQDLPTLAPPVQTAVSAPIVEQPAYQPQQPTYTQPVAQPVQQNIAVAQPQITATPLAQPAPAQSAPIPESPAVQPNPVPVMANATLRVVATGFRAPAGLTFDRNGYLYVANYLNNTIERIAPDGTRSQFSSGTNLRGPIGLAADDMGNVYVANYSGGTVAKINPAGVSTVVASGFKHPYYLVFDRDGNLYVSQQEDNSIVRITLPRPAAASKP